MSRIRMTNAQAKAMGLTVPKGAKGKPSCGKSPLVPLFLAGCEKHGIPLPSPEYSFHVSRKWKFDFAWPELLDDDWNRCPIALEVEGGVWTAGRHTRGKGFLGDMEKYNEAALLGWMVLRCTPKEIKDGLVFALLRKAIGGTP